MIEVAVGILSKNSEILVCQRKRTARYALKWEFPGGKLEDGESPEQCLRRELREELSVEAVVGHQFHLQSWVYPDSGTFKVYYFLIQSFTGTPRNNTFEQISWVAAHDLASIDMLDGNAEVVQKILRSGMYQFKAASRR